MFKIHELWKNENVSSQSMNYEIFFLEYSNYENIKNFVCKNMNYEDMKIFVCNTQFMKTWKYLFAKHEF